MTITTESSAPLFVVVGASGAQGGSVVRAIQSSSKAYRVRALGRDVTKPALKTLESQGAEIVAADTAKADDLKKAFAGADVVFLMTQVSAGTDDEYTSGKLQVETAEAAGVKAIAWASLPPIGTYTGGKPGVPHFDLKAKVASWARSANLKAKFHEIQPGCYDQNFIGGMMSPQKQADGSFILSVSWDNETRVPLLDMDEDFGRYVLAAIEKDVTEPVHAARVYASPAEIAAELSRVSGKKVVFKTLPDDDAFKIFEGFVGPALARDVVSMFQAQRSAGYYGGASLDESNKILDKPSRTLGQYLEANKEKVYGFFSQ